MPFAIDAAKIRRCLGLAGCVWLAACLPSRFSPAPGDSDGGGGTSEEDTDGPVASDVTPPSTTAPTTGVATAWGSDGEESSSSTGFYDPTAFLADPDAGYSECSPWDQNCPPGEKCMPWANDGGNAWNATRCSPIVPDPDQVDDPCTVEGSGVSGIDSCDIGLICFDVDTETNEGTCWPMCIGTENAPLCADPDRFCSFGGDGVLILCVPRCNPLEQDCAEGEGCYPTYDNAFVCAPDASGDEGAFGEPCEFINACDAGLACVSAEMFPDCVTSGCCTPYCDTSGPGTCPDKLLLCLPAIDEGDAPPGLENVGLCVAPEE